MVFALRYLAMAMYHHTHCLCVLRGFLLSADTLLHGICHSSEMNSIAHRYGYYTMMHTSQSYLTDMGTIQLHVSKLCALQLCFPTSSLHRWCCPLWAQTSGGWQLLCNNPPASVVHPFSYMQATRMQQLANVGRAILALCSYCHGMPCVNK